MHGLALARNVTNGNVPMEGVAAPGVAVVNAYPAGTSAGIEAAMGNVTGSANYTIDTSTAGTVIFQVNGAATLATCSVTYVQAAAGSVPTITALETGC